MKPGAMSPARPEPGSLRKVLFDFDAQDSVELTVRKGDVVTVRPADEQDPDSGWLLVATTDSRSGFIPAGYAETLESAPRIEAPSPPDALVVVDASPPAPVVQAQLQDALEGAGSAPPPLAPTPTPAESTVGPDPAPVQSRLSQRMSARTVASHQDDDLTSQGSAPAPSAAVTRGVPHAAPAPTPASSAAPPHSREPSVASAPAPTPAAPAPAATLGDGHLRAVSKKRRDCIATLGECVSETGCEIAECKARNQKVAASLREAEAILEGERKRIAAQLDADRRWLHQHHEQQQQQQAMQQQQQAMHVPSVP